MLCAVVVLQYVLVQCCSAPVPLYPVPVQYSTVVLHSSATVQYCTVALQHYCTVLYCTVQYSTVLYIQYSTVRTLLYSCTVQYSISILYTVATGTVQYSTITSTSTI